MQVERSFRQGVVILALSGRLDNSGADELHAQLLPLASEEGQRIVLDLSEVACMASSGLRLLLAATKRAKSVNSQIVLSAMTGPVQQVFELAGFGLVLAAYPTQEVAVEQLR